jgi:hypothetical protein
MGEVKHSFMLWLVKQLSSVTQAGQIMLRRKIPWYPLARQASLVMLAKRKIPVSARK